MERIDDLQFQGLHILQDDALPCFTEDAVHLVHFLRLSAHDRALDLGCGTGVIAILGAAYTGASFTGVDVQNGLVDLANRSARMNGQNIEFLTMDGRSAPDHFGHGQFTAVVCNPPYFHQTAQSDPRALSRHIEKSAFDALLHAAFLLLKNGGKAFFCYPASGLAELLSMLDQNRLTPKRLQFVAKSPSDAPYLALIEAKKDAKHGLFVEPSLFFCDQT